MERKMLVVADGAITDEEIINGAMVVKVLTMTVIGEKGTEGEDNHRHRHRPSRRRMAISVPIITSTRTEVATPIIPTSLLLLSIPAI